MKFIANSRIIRTILEAERKYIIPRYQREYSWESEQLEEFWDDITNQISFSQNNEYEVKEYFIGSLVMVGDDEQGTDFYVVDGQQRLTTITIILSVLTQIGKELKDEAFAKSCYRYIEGKDTDYKEFFKLKNETPKPFFQNSIQNYELDRGLKPTSEEERRLLSAYEYFYKKIIAEKESKDKFILFLKALRDQIIGCIVIFITVDNERDAQIIFETLNAKGKDLDTLDLVKNRIFEVLNKEHPSDFAKDTWKKVKGTIASREDNVKLSKFFRHFWISNYSFSTESKIYKLFLEKIEDTKESYESFMSTLLQFSENYIKVISPLSEDWKGNDEKKIFNSLVAIRDFRVEQPNPLMTTVINLYKNKKIKVGDLSRFFSTIESFHFIFSAITSSRASGLESLYSKYSRNLANVEDSKIKPLLNELTKKLSDKISKEITYEAFEKKFLDLKYSNSFTKQKKIIQYIFRLKERSMRKTNEISMDLFTLEHIQSQKQNTDWSYNIGNILPLAKILNEKCETKILKDKLSILKNSELEQVREFCNEYQDETEWTKELSEQRARNICKDIYEFSIKNLAKK